MEVLRVIKHTTPEECREIGEILLALADRPRDALWHANLDMVLRKFETPEERGVAEQMEELGRASDAVEAATWRTGWHPIQMRRALEEMSWPGADDADDPPMHLLRAERQLSRDVMDEVVRALRAREVPAL